VPLDQTPPRTLLRAVAVAALVMAVSANQRRRGEAAVICPDVSSRNHDHGGRVTWGAVHGVASFAYVKAIEGGDYLNPNFPGNFVAVHDVRRGLHGPRDPIRWARQARPYFAASLLVG
jgi:hypothetical protein